MVFLSVVKPTEIAVFNKLRQLLISNLSNTLQLVPPGGQAPLSITFSAGGNRRSIFPDLLTCFDSDIIVGEMKPIFSKEDAIKLQKLMTAEDGMREILSLVSRRTGKSLEMKNAHIHFVLIHSGAFKAAPRGINQLRFSGDDVFINNTLVDPAKFHESFRFALEQS